MPTEAEIEAAKQAAAAGGKKGANDGSAPAPEALKAAQDKAEQFRKEAEEAKEALEAKETELAELNEKAKLSESEKRRKALLEAGIDDDEALIAELEATAQLGEKGRWAKAVNAQIRKLAKEIAAAEVEKVLTKHQFERDLESRDEWLEDIAEKRSDTLKGIKDKLADYADMSLKGSPILQAKTAYKKFLEHEKFQKEKTEFEESKKKNGNFRDWGTDHKDSEKDGKIDFTKNWQAAKTQKEKEAALADI